MEISIIPYHQSYDSGIESLERKIWQGHQIKLKILKDHFLSRAQVFKNFRSYLAVNEENQVIATAISGQTKISINRQAHDCSIGFDVKVDPAYRNQGIGRKLAGKIIKSSNAEGIYNHMVTMKSANIPVIRLLSKATAKLWFYPFVYLTIPTLMSIETRLNLTNDQQFKICLFDQEELDSYCSTSFTGGLACFYTHKLYRLKIEKVSQLYKLGLKVTKQFQPLKYKHIPAENEEILFASLYNHTSKNIENLNEVLSYLRNMNINYLQVCCSKHDSIYQYLKKYSINTYSYTLITDFKLTARDKVALDVRCL